MNIDWRDSDDTIFKGLKYAEEKANKRRNNLYTKVAVEDLDDPMINETIMVSVEMIEQERMHDRELFNQLK